MEDVRSFEPEEDTVGYENAQSKELYLPTEGLREVPPPGTSYEHQYTCLLFAEVLRLTLTSFQEGLGARSRGDLALMPDPLVVCHQRSSTATLTSDDPQCLKLGDLTTQSVCDGSELECDAIGGGWILPERSRELIQFTLNSCETLRLLLQLQLRIQSCEASHSLLDLIPDLYRRRLVVSVGCCPHRCSVASTVCTVSNEAFLPGNVTSCV